MKEPNIPTHDGSIFTWRGDRGVADVSDFMRLLSARIWDDSDDHGFYVKSHRTGAVRLFVCVLIELEEDEWISTTYRSDGGYEIRIFND